MSWPDFLCAGVAILAVIGALLMLPYDTDGANFCNRVRLFLTVRRAEVSQMNAPRAVFAAIFVATVLVRLAVFPPGVWPLNYDAPYHVALIIKAYGQTSAWVHHWLPIVTLGAPMDKGIPWGATIAGPGGNFYYLSFPSLGFVVPYLVHAALGIEPTLRTLMIFNFGIHLAAALLMARVAQEVARIMGASEKRSCWIWLLAGGSYLLAREALFGHGPVYWSHSLFQVVWLGQILAFLLYVRRGRRAHLISLTALSIIGPHVEWSGYLANAGLVLALLITWWWRGKGLQAAALVAGATGTAGLLYVAQVVGVVGLTELHTYLQERVAGRAGSRDSGRLLTWLCGIITSAGLLPVIAVVAGGVLVTMRRRVPLLITAALVACIVPVSENVFLLDHAIEYPFDRLKILVPAIVLLSAAMAVVVRPMALRVGAVAWTIAIAGNVAAFAYSPRTIQAKVGVRITEGMWRQLAEFNRLCTVVTAVQVIRGYQNVLSGRSIYETVMSAEQMKAITDKRGACLGIWLTSDPIPEGWWNLAYVYDPAKHETIRIRADGSRETIP